MMEQRILNGYKMEQLEEIAKKLDILFKDHEQKGLVIAIDMPHSDLVSVSFFKRQEICGYVYGKQNKIPVGELYYQKDIYDLLKRTLADLVNF